MAEVVGAARKAAAKRPLWVKLSPMVADIGLIARTAEGAGADALTVANTYPAMAVDPVDWKVLPGEPNWGSLGPVYKTDHPAAGLGNEEGRKDTNLRCRRHRDGRRTCLNI